MKIAVVVGLIALIVACVVLGPLLAIWSLNVLFGLAIPYTLKTWLAALILGGMVHGSNSASGSGKS